MKNLKICLVDDDNEDREVFQEAFNELNSDNDFNTFKNGLEAVEYLNSSEEVPDIIFLDLNMPVMGGLDTLREIRKSERYKSLTVAIYSTSSAEKDIEETLIAGANVYIIKPRNFQCLKDAIAKVMKTNWQFDDSGLDKDTFLLLA